MEKIIENKVVVITGGAAGLGLEMVYKIMDKGAKRVIILDLNEKQGIDSIKELDGKYGSGKAVFYKCDVTTDLEDTFEKIVNEYKTIDVLINNAGVFNEKSIRKTINVNTIAVMEWSSKFYDYARKDRGGNGGTIINVSSIYGYRILAHIPYYHASKFAVVGFSKSFGHEYNYKKTGVRVVVLCPGLTHTNMVGNPQVRDDESLLDFVRESEAHDWQDGDAIGRGVVEIFEKADSGTVWLVEGARPAEQILANTPQ